jgi:hypothetical protein
MGSTSSRRCEPRTCAGSGLRSTTSTPASRKGAAATTTYGAGQHASRSAKASAPRSRRSAILLACSPLSAANKTSRHCNSSARSPNWSAALSAESNANRPPSRSHSSRVQQRPTAIAGETQMHHRCNTFRVCVRQNRALRKPSAYPRHTDFRELKRPSEWSSGACE